MTTDLGEHLRIIWRRKWLVLLGSLVLAGAVYWLSSQQSETYSASARLRLTPSQVTAGEAVGEDEASFLASSYAELVGTQALLEEAERLTDGEFSADEIEDQVSASGADAAGFIDIRATGSTPTEAETIAAASADALLAAVDVRQRQVLETEIVPIQEELERIEEALGDLSDDDARRGALEARYGSLTTALTERQLRAVDRLDIVTPAQAADDPVSPKPRRDALLAFIVGLVVYSELFVLAAAMGDRFSSEKLSEDVERVAGVPVLARMPQQRPDDMEEAFRELRTNLQFMAGIGGVRSVAVIGNSVGVGKTTTAAGLVRSFASIGIPTVIVDGDLRRPRLHERFELSRSPGLTDWLQEPTVQMVRRPQSEDGTLAVVTSGSPMANPSDVLTLRFGEVLAATRPAELVVVDTPPLDLFADGLAIASQCDLTIVVIDLRSTRKRALRSTVARLKQVDANLVGVVANRAGGVPRSGAYYDTSKDEVEGSGRRSRKRSTTQ